MTRSLLYISHNTLGNNHAVGVLALGPLGDRLYCKTTAVPKLLLGYLQSLAAALETLIDKGIKKCMVFLNQCDVFKFLMDFCRTKGERKILLDQIKKLRTKIEVVVMWTTDDSVLDHVTKNAWNLLVNGRVV